MNKSRVSPKVSKNTGTKAIPAHEYTGAEITSLWIKTPELFAEKQINQVISFIGRGKLIDGSPTTREFRDLLSVIPSSMLGSYAEQCLNEKFDDSGFALQDIVNETGRRLGFEVENGRYRGAKGQPGHDGIWRAPDGHVIIVEVKTTDVYGLRLDDIADYRHSLVTQNTIKEHKSSVLIVVGRQDTGGFEAQIRGSRHAWDIRVISVDALLRLTSVRQEVDDPAIVDKIASILVPHEYTKVDGIIDIVFSATEDARLDSVQSSVIQEKDEPAKDSKIVPVSFNDACVRRLEHKFNAPLVKRGRVLYSSPDNKIGLTCAVSREYGEPENRGFWFAFHPHQHVALGNFPSAYVCFGCGSEANVIVIPFHDFEPWLAGLNQTIKEDRFYWHVHISSSAAEGWYLSRKKGFERMHLDAYLLK